jgi:hypothetical protein
METYFNNNLSEQTEKKEELIVPKENINSTNPITLNIITTGRIALSKSICRFELPIDIKLFEGNSNYFISNLKFYNQLKFYYLLNI